MIVATLAFFVAECREPETGLANVLLGLPDILSERPLARIVYLCRNQFSAETVTRDAHQLLDMENSVRLDVEKQVRHALD